ncbi:MAG TPA: outer membrane protein transport protein [Stellaceae bacterium]|nr:outer membrane protein transport protein [Stellaceae bacterium]
MRENSAEALGTAFAGNASSADFLSTIFNNPAGMTEFTGDREGDGSPRKSLARAPGECLRRDDDAGIGLRAVARELGHAGGVVEDR